MKVLLLGADGMLGHRLFESWDSRHEMVPTLRRAREGYLGLPAGMDRKGRFGLDVTRIDDVAALMDEVRPELVVNAVGIVKQRPEAQESIPSLEVNALFPHRLARLCGRSGARMVQLSTDCVFSGSRGAYTEQDVPDPTDLYGRTKLLGEVQAPGCLNLRTSMIGLELERRTGLVEWFLAQRGSIKGYTGAIFSGFITAELARAIEALATQAEFPEGLWHLAMAPISKFDLLRGLNERLGRDVAIEPDESVRCDRSLEASALRGSTRYRPPDWGASLDELAAEIRQREARP